MSLIASQQLKDIAHERDISPQALAQEWILERLNWEGQAASAHDQRQVDDHTDEFHFPEGTFDSPVAPATRR